jgi:hypothetical protein
MAINCQCISLRRRRPRRRAPRTTPCCHVGRLVHRPGGAEHARWVFDYNPDEDDDDEAGYKFGTHAFVPGEYVSISGRDGKLQTFLVVTVDPVVLSVDLVKSFQLEINV